jgi:hypothetical protein
VRAPHTSTRQATARRAAGPLAIEDGEGVCRTTPGGIPVALLVDKPRRRRWPRVVALALAAALAAGAIPAWSRVQGHARPDPAAAPKGAARAEAASPQPEPETEPETEAAPR